MRNGDGRHAGTARVLLVVAVAALLWLSSGGVAQAHPVLLRSTPSDGQTVQTAPRQLDLWFSEPPTSAGIEVALTDRDGKAFPLTARIADQGIHVVLSGFPELPRSVYELRWSVVSKYDLHRLQGTLVFGVGLAATSTGQPARSVTGPAGTVADVVLGGLDLAATSVLCGFIFLITVRSRPGLPEPVLDSLSRFAVAFGFLSLMTSLLRDGRQWSEAARSEGGVAVLTGSGQLMRWGLREVALVVLLVLLARRLRGATGTIMLAVLLFADILLRAASSHARSGPLSLLVLAVHEAAGLTWVGGLAMLALLTAQLRENRMLALGFWKSFGPVAASCVGLLTVTGLILAGRQVATLDAAIGTAYGRALIVKLLVVAAVMALGLRHTRRLHPWLTRRADAAPVIPTSRGRVAAPILGVSVLLVAVVLAVTPPARGPQFDPPAVALPRSTYQIDDLLVTVSLTPNQPGRGLLMVDVVSSRRPAPGPVTGMTVNLGSGPGIALRRVSGDGARWQAPVDVEATGVQPLRIVASRDHPGPVTVSGTWVVPTGLPPRPVVISNSPLAQWAYGAAAVAALLVVGVAVLLIYRSRRTARRHRWVGAEQASG